MEAVRFLTRAFTHQLQQNRRYWPLCFVRCELVVMVMQVVAISVISCGVVWCGAVQALVDALADAADASESAAAQLAASGVLPHHPSSRAGQAGPMPTFVLSPQLSATPMHSPTADQQQRAEQDGARNNAGKTLLLTSCAPMA
jgi:hypothetical protein